MPVLEGIDQNTDEWLHARAGCVTASRMTDVIAKLKRKDGMAAARHAYLIEVVVGRLTGLNPEKYVTAAMQAGIDNEPLAKAAYEIATGNVIEDGGFWLHPSIKFFGASPDGLIGEEGLVEAKAPQPDTHLGYILDGVVPEEYMPQMIAQMACTGRKWVDFVSHCPNMPRNLRTFIRRYERDEALISQAELEVIQFLSEVKDLIAKLEAM